MDLNIEDCLRELKVGTTLLVSQKGDKPEKKYLRVRIESFELVRSENNCETSQMDLLDAVYVLDAPALYNDKVSKFNGFFTLVHGIDFPYQNLLLNCMNNNLNQYWITGLRFLIKSRMMINYSLKVSRWLWKNFYMISKRVHTNKKSGFSKLIPLCCGKPKEVKSLFNFHLLSKNNATDSDKMHLDNAANQFRGIISQQHDYLIELHDNMNHLLKADPTVTIASQNGSDVNPRHELEFDFLQLQNWFLKENIKLGIGEISFFCQMHNDNKPNFAAFQRLYDGFSYNPTDIVNKNIGFGHQCYLRISEKTFIDFYVEQEKYLKGSFEELRIEASAVYSQLIIWNKALCSYDEDANNESKVNNLDLMNYLFSSYNSLWNPAYNKVHQNMDDTLSNYWIHSSHNTYLVGDQIKSQSSCASYETALLKGCRCLELDCWDGDSAPIIKHGNTFTSKITVKNAAKAIRDFAFAVSDYPLILSIENHCSIPQQKIMAKIFRDEFKDMLLTSPLDDDSEDQDSKKYIPSPNKLKRKILIKGKKFKVGSENLEDDDIEDKDTPILASQVYLSSDINSLSRPFYASLEQNKTLIINQQNIRSENYSPDQIYIDESRYLDLWTDRKDENSNVGRKDYFYEPFYQNKMTRLDAEKWLIRYTVLGIGTFLVRPSETVASGLSLSVVSEEAILHYLIYYASVDNESQYNISKSNKKFKTCKELVEFYMENSLPNSKKPLRLKNPAPKCHLMQPWYNEITIDNAITILYQINRPGAFLVTWSANSVILEDKNEPDLYTLCCVVGNKKITRIDLTNLYTSVSFHTHEFRCLTDLVEDFRKRINPKLGVRLEIPVKLENLENIQKILANPSDFDENDEEENNLEFDVDKLKFTSIDKNSVYGIKVVQKNKKIEFYLTDSEERNLWLTELERIKQEVQKNQEIEKSSNLALELSDIVVYFRSIHYKKENINHEAGIICSFDENKFVNLVIGSSKEAHANIEQAKQMWRFLERHFARIYPKGIRFTSSNYDPVLYWAAGAQIVALNLQTCDRSVQLNQGKFRENGNCGYVLRAGGPNDIGDKNEKLNRVGCQQIEIELIGARHLPKTQKSYLEVELITDPWDKYGEQLYRVATRGQLCAIPDRRVPMTFRVKNPESALLRFSFISTDESADQGRVSSSCIKSSDNLMLQYTTSASGIRSGIRSVLMDYPHGSPTELTTFLFKVSIMPLDIEEYVMNSIPSSSSDMSLSSRTMNYNMNLMQTIIKEILKIENIENSEEMQKNAVEESCKL